MSPREDDPARPFTREEVAAAGSGRPSRGLYCSRCETFIPVFAELSPEEEQRLRAWARSGRSAAAMQRLRDVTGCSIGWAKIWIHHPDGPEAKGFRGNARCPFCGGRLRTDRARQCPHCLMSWHDPQRPRKLGS